MVKKWSLYFFALLFTIQLNAQSSLEDSLKVTSYANLSHKFEQTNSDKNFESL